jgi:hypothetical protein
MVDLVIEVFDGILEVFFISISHDYIIIVKTTYIQRMYNKILNISKIK